MCLRAQALCTPSISTLPFLPCPGLALSALWGPLVQCVLSSPGPSTPASPGLDPSGPSHLQLQHFHPDGFPMEETSEAMLLECLIQDWKYLVVHIREREEFGLEGAGGPYWLYHCHLFS